MAITAEQVKQLRDKTGAGMMDCKTALTESRRRHGQGRSSCCARRGSPRPPSAPGRATKDGMIGHYIHLGGKVGVLVEVNCETDFVARTDDFQALAKELAMHIAAADPAATSSARTSRPTCSRRKRRSTARSSPIRASRPTSSTRSSRASWRAIYAQVCLLDQPSVRDPDVTIKQMVATAAAKTGENVTVSRFARFKLGELAGE